MSHYYPEIDQSAVKNIKIAAALAKEHPSYFLEGHYPASVEEVIMAVLRSTEGVKGGQSKGEYQDQVFTPKEVSENATKWDILIRESEQLYNDLKASGVKNQEGDEMAYFRTATSLLEKIVGLQERALGLKQVHDFQQRVMEIMENVLSPTQRTKVMEDLKNAIGE